MANGFQVSKRGWPDFFIWKGEEFACVEVKRSGGYPLKKHQELVMETLAKKGVPCYRWDFGGQVTPIGPSPPILDWLGQK